MQKSSRELGSVDEVEHCSSWLDEVNLPVLEVGDVINANGALSDYIRTETFRIASVQVDKHSSSYLLGY